MWFVGFIYDRTNNYNIPFFVSGAIQMLGGALCILAVIVKRISVRAVID